MTNDDELLSAYIDGEANQEEVGRVEGDPELLAAAEALRTLSGEMARVPAPTPDLRDRHLTAALELFESTREASQAATGTAGPADSGGTDAPPEVVSLSDRRAATRAAEPERASRWSGGLPTWLGAAAAVLLVFGGLGFVISRGDDGGFDGAFSASDEETAATEDATDAVDDAAEESTDFDEESEEARLADLDQEAAADGDDAVAASAAESSPDQPTSGESESDDAGDDEASADEAPAASVSTTSTSVPTSTVTTSPGLFPEAVEERRILLASRPDEAEAASLVTEARAGDGLLPAAFASCGVEVAQDTGARLVGFLPLAVSDVPHELLVLDVDGVESLVLVDDRCAVLS